MMRIITMILILFSALQVVIAEPIDKITFSVKPSVIKDGNITRIKFAISASSDVEVAVLDAKDKIVRHLAAGVLGGKNPPPKPEIPMGWPIFAGASDKYIYVGDCLNHRVIRVDKQFATEETCKEL